VCDDDISLTQQASFEKSLTNNFFDKYSYCVYDYDTVMDNIIKDSAEHGGFIWTTKYWIWVTGWTCFATSLSEFEAVYARALNQCEAQN